jgi:chemotaxis protein methyltransferase CheR
MDENMNFEVDGKTYAEFIKLVHKYTGITIAPNRHAMLQGRLRPRLRQLSLLNFPQYLEYLQTHTEETSVFVDLMTTNETYFYRTPRVWEYIEKEFLPQWQKNHKDSVLTAWSAAASSGEEASTLAVLLHQMKMKSPSFKYQIIATDISQEILNTAEKGEYSGKSIEFFKNTRPELFKNYLKKNNSGSYSLIAEARQNIQYQKHNLFEIPKMRERFDLVLIRNVLIYFKPLDQEKVLSNISHVFKKDGQLIIGESESLNRLKTPFQYAGPLVYNLANDKKESQDQGSAA